MKLHNSSIAIIFIFLIILLPFFALIWYLFPINETMKCGENYVCTVEKTRYFSVKETKEIYIDKNSILSYEYKYSPCGRRNILCIPGHLYNVVLDGTIKPFKFPVCYTGKYDYKKHNVICPSYFEGVIREFDNYKLMPFKGFALESQAKNIYYFKYIVLCFLLSPFIIWLLYLIQKFKKRYKQYKNHLRKHKNIQKL